MIRWLRTKNARSTRQPGRRTGCSRYFGTSFSMVTNSTALASRSRSIQSTPRDTAFVPVRPVWSSHPPIQIANADRSSPVAPHPRRLRRTKVSKDSASESHTVPNNAQRKASTGYRSRNSAVVNSSGNWKHSTPSRLVSPAPAAKRPMMRPSPGTIACADRSPTSRGR